MVPMPPAATRFAEDPDADVARRVAASDWYALERLMRSHNQTLFRTARSILRDDAEAEDAVQDAFVAAYRAIGTFRGEAKLSTWLVRIVANEALQRLRRRGRTAEVIRIEADAAEADVDADTLDAMPAAADGPERSAMRTQTRRMIEAGIDRLPDAFRTVFVLRAVEELSVEETAAALGIPEATVRSRHFRARSMLRESLARELDIALDRAYAFAGERCDRIVDGVFARLSAWAGWQCLLDRRAPTQES